MSRVDEVYAFLLTKERQKAHDIVQATGFPAGTVRPALLSLESAGKAMKDRVGANVYWTAVRQTHFVAGPRFPLWLEPGLPIGVRV